MQIENWKTLEGYKGNYELSSFGRIRCLDSGNLIPTHIGEADTNCITLRALGSKLGTTVSLRIDQAVAAAFLPNTKGYSQVKHLDGQLLNDRQSNLRWIASKRVVDSPVVLPARKDDYLVSLPASAPSVLLHRIRKPISVHFLLRPIPHRARLAANDHYLQVRLAVYSLRATGFNARERLYQAAPATVSFGKMIVVDKSRWNTTTSQMRGQEEAILRVNQLIEEIEATLKAIFTEQQRRHWQQNTPPPTVNSVKYEYLYGSPPVVSRQAFAYPAACLSWEGKNYEDSPGIPQNVATPVTGDSPLLEVMSALLRELAAKRLAGQMAPTTYKGRQATLDYLTHYLPAAGLRAQAITPFWLKQFHGWLLQQPCGRTNQKKGDRHMKPGTASRHCWFVVEAMDWLRSQHLILVNPIREIGLPISKPKDVYFLESIHVERLFALSLPELYQDSLWWFKLICLTGLNYPDALRYAFNRSTYERLSPGGNPKLVIRRAKPPQNECTIPVSPRLTELWATVGDKPPREMKGTTFRSHLAEIQKRIGFDKPLTPTIGRKSAGVLFLKQHSIKGLSGILGHSSIRTTEKHYVKITGNFVDLEMDTLGQAT